MLKPNMCEARDRKKVEIDYKYVDATVKKYGENKKYFVRTYGCQMNEHDTENIKEILENLSFIETSDFNDADVIVLNTCSIRENANNKVFGMIGRVKHLKEEKDVVLILAGCMSQEEKTVEEYIKLNKVIDIVLGTHNIHRLPMLLEEFLKGKKQVIEVYSNSNEVIETSLYKREFPFKAWVNVMYGCDNFCTYCIVPYTRGRQRSRKFNDIINEVKELAEKGYKEITLLGQNVNAYGKDLEEEIMFSDLLREVAKFNIPRIRFVTSHPWDFTNDLINVVKENDNVMPYIHLPLQAGSDEVLRKMGRKYTKKEYLELAGKIKEGIPNVSITTDIIVGFPNETKEDFLETLRVVDEVKYDSAFTFIYSKREGTPAALIEDNITLEEKEERLRKLNKKVNEYSRINNEKYLNKIVKVLIEKENPKNKEVLSGYTETMKLVNVKLDKSYIGKIVEVKITETKSFSLNGELVK